MQVTAEVGARTLRAELDEHVAELARLHLYSGGVPRGVTDTNGNCGSHHYFLDLRMVEARMVVMFLHGIFLDEFVKLAQAYKTACKLGTCLCNVCTGFGSVYLVLSPCECARRREVQRLPLCRLHRQLPPT